LLIFCVCLGKVVFNLLPCFLSCALSLHLIKPVLDRFINVMSCAFSMSRHSFHEKYLQQMIWSVFLFSVISGALLLLSAAGNAAEPVQIPAGSTIIHNISVVNTGKGTAFNVAEENLQARIRGNLLMAMSNKFNYLVLATGNKSELSVGYATLYGDMCGGLAVISDLFKTTVYELAEYVNKKAGKEIIPPATITKEPSAELREGQKDSDSLPVYPVLDPILKAYVEDEKSKEEIIALGFPEEVVAKVIKMVDRNEYKRQQAALGLRITPRAFGSGRRMPITNGWKE